MNEKCINLNADLGESFGAYSIGDDEAMLDIVSTANVGCGFHGGDHLVMRRTVQLAAEKGVSIGAHPSFPDRQGFGRRRMDLDHEEIEALILYQTGALMAVAKAAGTEVTHVKPHGALNTMAAKDIRLSLAIAQAMKALDPHLILLAPATSAMVEAGDQMGLRVAGEIFADRTYGEDGHLTPRSEPNAFIHDAAESVRQIMTFLKAGGIVTPSGKVLPASLHSVCVHGDGPKAVTFAGQVRKRLVEDGWQVPPLPAALA
ncbi:MAG: LamB/YcsF family protein [Magnetovibrionaceae bacterium]